MLGITVAPRAAAAGTVKMGLKVDAVLLTVAPGELVIEVEIARVVALWPADSDVVVSTLELSAQDR